MPLLGDGTVEEKYARMIKIDVECPRLDGPAADTKGGDVGGAGGSAVGAARAFFGVFFGVTALTYLGFNLYQNGGRFVMPEWPWSKTPSSSSSSPPPGFARIQTR